MKMRWLIIMVLAVVLCSVAKAQNTGRQNDSILALASSAPDSVAVIIYKDLCWNNRFTNPSLGVTFGQRAADIAKRLEDWEGLCLSYSFMGVCSSNFGNLTDALEYYNAQLSEAQAHNIESQIAWGNNNIGEVFCHKGMYSWASQYLDKALSHALERGDSTMLAYIYKNMGRAHETDPLLAMEYYRKSLDIRIARNADPMLIAQSMISVGNMYQRRHEYDSASYYYHECLSHRLYNHECALASELYSELSNVHYKRGNFSMALQCADKAYDIAIGEGNREMVKAALQARGNAYFGMGKYEPSLSCFLNTILYSDSIYSTELTQKIYHTQYYSEKYIQDIATNKLDQEQSIQHIYQLVLTLFFVTGCVFAYSLIRRRRKLNAVNQELEKQKQQLDSSIEYARQLQQAMLPQALENKSSIISDSFVLLLPKDIVGGNFFWHNVSGNYEMVAMAEYPASGTAGGCMTFLGSSYMHEFVDKHSALRVLEQADTKFKELFSLKGHTSYLDSGLRMAVMVFNKTTRQMRFASAGLPLICIRDGRLKLIAPTSQPIMSNLSIADDELEVELGDGDCVYLGSSGYCAQTGGPQNSTMDLQLLENEMVKNAAKPMSKQKESCLGMLNQWRGNNEQIADVCVIGMRIKWALASLLIMLAMALPNGAMAENVPREVTDKIDSLSNLILAASDGELPNLYSQLAWAQRNYRPLSGYESSLKAIEWANKMGDKEQLMLAYEAAGANQFKLEKYDEAMYYYQQAMYLARDLDNKQKILSCNSYIGQAYMNLEDFEMAGEYFRRALSISTDSHDLDNEAFAQYCLGILHHKCGKLDTALENFARAGELWESLRKNASRLMAPKLQSARIYMESHDYKKAKDVYYGYMDRYRDEGYDIKLIPDIYCRLATIYMDCGMLDSAEYFVDQQHNVAYKNGSYAEIRKYYRQRTLLYQAKGDYRTANEICLKFAAINDSLFFAKIQDEGLAKGSAFKSYQSQIEYEKALGRRKMAYIVTGLFLLALTGGLVFIIVMRKNNERMASSQERLMEQKKKVLDNINYTYYIQTLLLPSPDKVGISFSDRFVLFVPKDIVSGDFYWCYQDADCEMIAVADCTGHGVPGAMLTMLGMSALQEIASSGERDAGRMLHKLRENIKYMMSQNENKMHDGMDISLAVIDRHTMQMCYAGAFSPMIYIHDNTCEVLKATRCPIGDYVDERPFESQTVQLKPGDCIYMMSDGYHSQFGGPSDSKFPKRRLRELLLKNHQLPMQEQKTILHDTLIEWQGNSEQVDDITMLGMRV